MSRCGEGLGFGDECVWPRLERLEVLVEGSVGSKRPAFCEFLRLWITPRLAKVGVIGDGVAGCEANGEGTLRGGSAGDRGPVTERAAVTAAVEMAGREKFCELLLLLLLLLLLELAAEVNAA
jgi:hypothetical protein